MDQFEAEIESLVGLGGKKKKGKTEADARSDECQVLRSALCTPLYIPVHTRTHLNSPVLQAWVEKHRDHIQRLETLLRMLDNDQVSQHLVY